MLTVYRMACSYVFYCSDGPQLFDLEADPGENENLLETRANDGVVQEAADNCHRRLLSICDPYAVNERAKEFQKRIKAAMGITAYTQDMGQWVPHPEALPNPDHNHSFYSERTNL